MTHLTNDPNNPALYIIDPENGMQLTYLVLSDEERAKGFVRQVRRSYKHVGCPPPRHPLRELTPEEHERYDKYRYEWFEAYPEDDARSASSSVSGRFWTRLSLRGCGTITTMSTVLAETYARQPDYYGGTYCAGCQGHFPVGSQGEFVWYGTHERVGT